MLYVRVNRQTGQEVRGQWEEISQLDVREWTYAQELPVFNCHNYPPKKLQVFARQDRIYLHTINYSARLASIILRSAQHRTSPPVWAFYAIKRDMEVRS